MEDDEIIGSDSQPQHRDEEILAGGASSAAYMPEEILVGNNVGTNAGVPHAATADKDAVATELTTEEMITATTATGGLTAITPEYRRSKQRDTEGPWSHIRDVKNPFRMLFLDYRLHHKITPEMVSGNYNLLSAQWAANYNNLEGVNRAKVVNNFGEEFIPHLKAAGERLLKAFNQIRTQEGIDHWAAELNMARINSGTLRLQEFFDYNITRGIFEKEEGQTLIKKGKEYGLSEEEVRGFIYNQLVTLGFKERAEIKRPDFFDNDWMSDEAWQRKKDRARIEYQVLNRPVSSLHQLGKVLYEQEELAKERYINSIAYLPAMVTTLEGSDAKGRVYEDIINEEKDVHIRFLKIVYQLNPTLPLKVGEMDFKQVKDLFAQTKYDKNLFIKAIESFRRGYLQIWLQATDPDNAALLPDENNYIGFVSFFLQIEPSHPVVISNEQFESPLMLAQLAKNNHSYWPKITEAMANGILPTWFEGIGKANWIPEYNAAIEPILNAAYYTEEDKKATAVQTLLQIIDSSIKDPLLETGTTSIELLSVDASKVHVQGIGLKLTDTGFVKSRIYVDHPIDGISVQQNTLLFNTLQPASTVNIIIDPVRLDKGKTYTVNVIIETRYQRITIPVTVQAIFPQSVFYKYLAKYGLFSALFFFIIRVILTIFTDDNRMYFTAIPSVGSFWGAAIDYKLGYVVTFLILLLGIWAAIRITKNKEKI